MKHIMFTKDQERLKSCLTLETERWHLNVAGQWTGSENRKRTPVIL